MIALTPKEEFTYVPRSERESNEPSTFMLRPLSMRETIEIEDWLGSRATEGGYPAGTMNYKVLKRALIGFENVSMEWVEDDDGTVSDTVLERIPMGIRTELANVVWGLGSISDDDAKN